MNEYEIYIPWLPKVNIWADRMFTNENGQTFLYKTIKSTNYEFSAEEEVITVIPKEAFVKVTMINNKLVL
jgi:hypothetical protein